MTLVDVKSGIGGGGTEGADAATRAKERIQKPRAASTRALVSFELIFLACGWKGSPFRRDTLDNWGSSQFADHRSGSSEGEHCMRGRGMAPRSYADANFRSAILGGVSEALASKTTTRSRDEEPHSEPHVASFN